MDTRCSVGHRSESLSFKLTPKQQVYGMDIRMSALGIKCSIA